MSAVVVLLPVFAGRVSLDHFLIFLRFCFLSSMEGITYLVGCVRLRDIVFIRSFAKYLLNPYYVSNTIAIKNEQDSARLSDRFE